MLRTTKCNFIIIRYYSSIMHDIDVIIEIPNKSESFVIFKDH